MHGYREPMLAEVWSALPRALVREVGNSFFSGYVDTTGTAGGLYGYLKNNQNGGTAGKEFRIENSYVGGRNRSYGYTESGAEVLSDRKNVSGGWCAEVSWGGWMVRFSVIQSFQCSGCVWNEYI